MPDQRRQPARPATRAERVGYLTGKLLPGGFVDEVVRVGDTVRKPYPADAAFVRRLLARLAEHQRPGAPRFPGIATQGAGSAASSMVMRRGRKEHNRHRCAAPMACVWWQLVGLGPNVTDAEGCRRFQRVGRATAQVVPEDRAVGGVVLGAPKTHR
jgi:hypothetical protein